jgi:LysR family hydrogen peroxide-inducible transcriptional activator
MTTLRQLRYLVALAEQGHFGRAAEHCHVTQPALSQQLSNLEAQLGAKLIERTQRGAELTEIGAGLVDRARAILAGVADLERSAQGTEEIAGAFRLGVIPTVAPYLLPQALPRMRAAFPAAEFSIREAVTETLLAQLRSGGLDAVLVSLPVQEEAVETLPILEDPFWLITASTDKPKGPVDAGSLATDGLLLLEEGHCLREQALGICNVDPASRAELGATSLATLVQLAAAGLGRTLVPGLALDTLVSSNPRVAATALSEPVPSRLIGLGYRATSSRKQALSMLAEAIGGGLEVPHSVTGAV